MEFEPSTNILTLGGSLSMKRQIVDKIILKRRALEEIAILQREMCDYMRFYIERVIPHLESQKVKYQKLTEEVHCSGVHSFNR